MKKILSVILVLLTLFELSIFAKAENCNSISLSAKSAILIEAETNKVLYSKQENLVLPMASTTKIMTAIVVIENSNLDSEVLIDDRSVGIEGSSAYLKKGERFTVLELLYMLLLRSANDSAVALACAVSGNVDNFVQLMNQKAKELNLVDTHFDNPNGLHSNTHYTTAKELAILASYALKNEVFKKIVSTKSISIKGDNGEIDRYFTNHNKLLLTYGGVYGVKTGFTKDAGRCLVSACQRDGLSLIAVTLSAPNDWQDHKTLYDFGFQNYQRIVLCKANELNYSIPIADGGNLTVSNNCELSIFEPKNDSLIEKQIELPSFVYRGIKKGDKIGKVVYLRNGKVLGEVALLANESIIKPEKISFFKKIIDFFIRLFKK